MLITMKSVLLIPKAIKIPLINIYLDIIYEIQQIIPPDKMF